MFFDLKNYELVYFCSYFKLVFLYCFKYLEYWFLKKINKYKFNLLLWIIDSGYVYYYFNLYNSNIVVYINVVSLDGDM